MDLSEAGAHSKLMLAWKLFNRPQCAGFLINDSPSLPQVSSYQKLSAALIV